MFELTQPVGRVSRGPLPGSGGVSLLMFTQETNTYLQMVIINNKIGKRPQQQFGKKYPDLEKLAGKCMYFLLRGITI